MGAEKMMVVGIVGSGPVGNIPDLGPYFDEVDVWIGADRGALVLMKEKIRLDYAVGDFDSVTEMEREQIVGSALQVEKLEVKKDETDLEIALRKATMVGASKVYLFGVTGGRLDHEFANMQLLHVLLSQGICGVIVDRWNQIELKEPGSYTVLPDEDYSYVSFVPFTEWVRGVELVDFLYPLDGIDITWGQTRLISNEFSAGPATFSFVEGLLLFIRSRD